MNIFLTGCDDNTAWQLPWFLHNFRANCKGELYLADFGLTHKEVYDEFDGIVKVKEGDGWFKKPSAILKASRIYGITKVCWLDTDCEVKQSVDDIFDLSVPQQLGMVEDRPWTKRRGQWGKWYNSGVVLVEGFPTILGEWARECIVNPVQGDQEVLHEMTSDPLRKLKYINPLPHKYNTLRIDYMDGIADKNPRVVHHTGLKGKNKIQIDIAMGLEKEI